jgi:hypothetical protein
MFGPARCMRRIDGEHLADNEPIKEHASRCQMLLDRRLGGRRLQRLDVGSDMHGLDIGELADLVLLDPGLSLRRRHRLLLVELLDMLIV